MLFVCVLFATALAQGESDIDVVALPAANCHSLPPLNESCVPAAGSVQSVTFSVRVIPKDTHAVQLWYSDDSPLATLGFINASSTMFPRSNGVFSFRMPDGLYALSRFGAQLLLTILRGAPRVALLPAVPRSEFYARGSCASGANTRGCPCASGGRECPDGLACGTLIGVRVCNIVQNATVDNKWCSTRSSCEDCKSATACNWCNGQCSNTLCTTSTACSVVPATTTTTTTASGTFEPFSSTAELKSPSGSTKSASQDVVPIAAGAGAGGALLLLAGIAVCVCLQRRRTRQSQKESDGGNAIDMKGYGNAPPEARYSSAPPSSSDYSQIQAPKYYDGVNYEKIDPSLLQTGSGEYNLGSTGSTTVAF
jgi:hypothetical protein